MTITLNRKVEEVKRESNLIAKIKTSNGNYLSSHRINTEQKRSIKELQLRNR